MSPLEVAEDPRRPRALPRLPPDRVALLEALVAASCGSLLHSHSQSTRSVLRESGWAKSRTFQVQSTMCELTLLPMVGAEQ